MKNENDTFAKMYQLNSRLSDLFSRAYPTRTAGVTRLQSKVLYMLDQFGTMTMGELAGRLNAHNSNLTPVVDQLYSDGFVDRIPSQTDRRVVEIAVTEKGRALSRELTDRINEFVRNIPEQERAEIRQALIDCAEML